MKLPVVSAVTFMNLKLLVNNSIVSQHLDAVIFLNEINTRQASSITTG